MGWVKESCLVVDLDVLFSSLPSIDPFAFLFFCLFFFFLYFYCLSMCEYPLEYFYDTWYKCRIDDML